MLYLLCISHVPDLLVPQAIRPIYIKVTPLLGCVVFAQLVSRQVLFSQRATRIYLLHILLLLRFHPIIGVRLLILTGELLWRMNIKLLWLMEPGALFLAHQGLMWSQASGFINTSIIQMALLLATRLDGLFEVFHNSMELIMTRLSVLWLSLQLSGSFLALQLLVIGRSISLM